MEVALALTLAWSKLEGTVACEDLVIVTMVGKYL